MNMQSNWIERCNVSEDSEERALVSTSLLADSDPDLVRIMSPGMNCYGAAILMLGLARTCLCDRGNNLALIEAIDDLTPGEVLVAAAGGGADFGFLGEILLARAVQRGARGIVIDGGVRDIAQLRAGPIPVFARAASPRKTIKSEGGLKQIPILCGNVVIRPGDIIVGDEDGCIVIPPAALHALEPKARALRVRELDMLAQAGTAGAGVY